MFDKNEFQFLSIGLIVRLFLFFHSRSRQYFENSVEYVTPLNSWKRVTEGIYLRNLNVSPFVGSIVHETPLSLFIYSKLDFITNGHMEFVFIVADLICAIFSYKLAKIILTQLFEHQQKMISTYENSSEPLWLTKDNIQGCAKAVLLMSMINPLSIDIRHSLVVVCMMLVAFLMAPICWYLWIYTGSANANFYFAMTMVFNVAQTFLISDLLYAYLKRKFFLENGLTIPQINDKEAQLEFR
ncbi:unnamed protein product [Didymodactylos carnosus]|uniref:Uncharacterized protein n=1 Tax=Didymodactylos carnosus TaxID=1234261 RepID=A0A813VN39_9BILA|nr:unnamed protein product [Didymodactylos carnosus]CAF3630445.1 unnamed protein product [Didymodactylos carnosus]